MTTPSAAAMRAANDIIDLIDQEVLATIPFAEIIDRETCLHELIEAADSLCISVEEGHNELGKAMVLRSILFRIAGRS